MKLNILYLLIIACLSCNKQENTTFNTKRDQTIPAYIDDEKMQETSLLIKKELTALYNEAEAHPENVLREADSLIAANQNEQDAFKKLFKQSVESNLMYLKAELHYRLGNYKTSLTLLADSYARGTTEFGRAANYIKLKQFDDARMFIDQGKGYYIYEYDLGNYYECIGDKKSALKTYYAIRQDKERKHYTYYNMALERITALEKKNPKLLNEIYFPTRNPEYEIAKSDSPVRTKIFDIIEKIPETKGYAIQIYESPQINDKDYYWVKVGTFTSLNIQPDYKAKYDFFVYPKNFEVKHFDPKTNKTYSLDQWRKNRH
jgi:hypothetical protein